MQPIYFLADVQREQVLKGDSIDRALLCARGLGLVFDDVEPRQIAAANLTGNGPGDKPGCVIAYQTADGVIPDRMGYFPDEISWEEINPKVYIGIRKNSPPTESDLRRSRTFQGYDVTMASGEKYIVPVIRRPDNTTDLPRSLRLDKAGCVVETIREQYRSYWDASASVIQWFTAENGFNEFDKAGALRLAVSALSLNYRFGMDEQNAIGLLDSESYLSVLSCSIDLPAILRAQEAKKKNP